MFGKKQKKQIRRPIREFRSSSEDLRLFHDVARALTSSLELESLLSVILSLMEDFFGPEQWSLLMMDEETQELYYALSSGLDRDKLKPLRIKFGEGIAGLVAKTGVPLVVPDVENDSKWSEWARSRPEIRLHSIACLPIRHSNRTLGVLQIYNSQLNLPETSMSFLRVLCDYTAIALENARQVKLIHHLSITDDCTGLFNSRYLYTMLEQEIAALADPQVISIRPHFSLLFLDLDYFKTVNDANGHLVGSRLLAEIGSLMKRTIGPEHAGFRYGGDEFVILMRGLDKPQAIALANQVRDDLRNAHFLNGDGLDLRLTASFGLATFPEDGDTLHSIIRAADTMMYKSKADGRDRLSVAEAGVESEFVAPRSSRHVYEAGSEAPAH